MNDTIVNNINSVVEPGDILLHLGDWSFGGKDNIKIARDRIVCNNIVAVNGNHDHNIKQDKDLQQKLFIWCGDYLEFRVGKKLICCFHYPTKDWNEKNKESLMIHGHCHSIINSFEDGKKMEIGVDSHNMTPWNLMEILTLMETVPVLANHHEGLR